MRWGVFGLFVLVAALLGFVGLEVVATQRAPGVTFLCLAALCAVFAWLTWRDARRPRSGLTVVVRADRLELIQGGDSEVVRRPDVGLIVLHVISGPGGAGLVELRIFRPDQSLLGHWYTEWFRAGPVRSMRAFGHFGYPWIVHDTGALFSNDRFRSRTAPAWAEAVARASSEPSG